MSKSNGHATGGRSSRRLWRWLAPRIAPSLFVIGGISLLVWTGVRATSVKQPPSEPEAAALVLLSSVFQITGGTLFGRIGRTDANHARSEVRRLITIGRSLGQSRNLLQSGDSNDLSVDRQLAGVSLQLEDAIRGWNDVHKEALDEVMELKNSLEEEEL